MISEDNKSEEPSQPRQRVSAILRRQIPIRHGEAPRSWLGGLPMMPRDVQWPRDETGAPLHFLAQICCADLPADLWNGYGPRDGWLLLFVETLEYERRRGGVQVMHVERLGVEHAPPEDAPTVRHSMSDSIANTAAEIRPGVPKFWRKWPVDIYVHRYFESEDGMGPAAITDETVYGAPALDGGIWHNFRDWGLSRPITWQGALYVVEGALRRLEPKTFARQFERDSGLLAAPEPDFTGVNQEVEKRLERSKANAADAPGYEARRQAIYEEVVAELRAEHSTGWLVRTFAEFEGRRAKYQGEIEALKMEMDVGDDSLDDEPRESKQRRLEGLYETLAQVNHVLDDLAKRAAGFSGPDREAALAEDIKAEGEAYFAWGEAMRVKVGQLYDEIRARTLTAPLRKADWVAITKILSDQEKAHFWRQRNSYLLPVEKTLAIEARHLDMAIREDILDLYARGTIGLASLSKKKLRMLEQGLRHFEGQAPHRMGGHPNLVQYFELEPEEALLFQLNTDGPMGWMWGDCGIFYVTMLREDLKQNKFGRLEAFAHCH